MFPERQVVSASVNLKWDPNTVAMNSDSNTGVGQFINSLTGSTASVTLSDPYMTGVAWAALFDSAAAYTTSRHAAANNIMLPACGEGESPASGKCVPYVEIEDQNIDTTTFGSFAHILIYYHYDVAGTRFGLTTYFRLQGFSIEHGKSYPRVNLQGIHPQTVVFNQNLVNFQMEENKTLEENLKDIVEKYDYKATFCTDPTQSDTKRYVMPKGFKERGVTGGEILKKYLDSVGGTYLSLPTKEFANKISLCTRANINQGCSVFYLGKGLYEGYNLSGQVPQTLSNLNAEFGYYRGLGYEYDRDSVEEVEYEINDIYPERRREKLKEAKTSLTSFPEQFSVYEKRFMDNLSNSGLVWMSSGPKVKTEKKQKINLYGVNVSGGKPIAFLDGKVVAAPRDNNGLILIATNYFIRFCQKGNKAPCQNRVILQETINLTISGEIKVGTEVGINQELGTSAEEYTRFILDGVNRVTISPEIVWKYAVPSKELTEEERKNIKLRTNESTPSGPSPGGSGSNNVIGKVGNTGYSTAPHLHAQYYPSTKSISREDLEGIIEIGGKPPSQWPVTSAYGVQRENGPHGGVDLGSSGVNINNQPITLLEGKVVTTGSDSRSGNFVVIDTSRGQMLLAHLADGSTAGATGVNVGSGSRAATGIRGGPAVNGAIINTEFKGVPRALRIIPGRTILSFITRYDEWVERGRPSDIDPGVWLPERFSKWFVQSVNYNWNQGDLRVALQGITDWGNLTAKADSPSFDEYLSVSGFNKTKDYYGYIRSLGDLCWKLASGKTSCEERCEDAENIGNFLRAPTDGSSPSIDSTFTASQCTYEGTAYRDKRAEIEQIMGAMRSIGVNTREAYAGVVGNLLKESGAQFNRHRLARPGSGCSRSPRGTEWPDLWPSAYGIAQWCGSRQDNLIKKYGRDATFGQQMQFMLEEIKSGRDVFSSSGRRDSFSDAMNAAKTPEEAALVFNDYFTKGDPAGRGGIARDVYDGLKCARISP